MKSSTMRKSGVSFILFLLIAVIVSSAAEPAMAKTAKKLTKEYTFKSDTYSNFNYPAKKEIKKDGKIYELKDISYKVEKQYKPVRKKVSYNGLSSRSVPEKRTFKVDGKTVRLTLKKKGVSYVKHQRKRKDRKYHRNYHRTISRTGVTSRPNFPSTIKMRQNGRNLTGRLTNITSSSSSVPFLVTGRFFTNSRASDNYYYRNERIKLTGNGPSFTGYENVILDALGLDKDRYTLRSASWRGGFYSSAAVFI